MYHISRFFFIVCFTMLAGCSTVPQPIPPNNTPAPLVVTTLTEPFTGSGDVEVGPDGNIYVGDFGVALGSGGINGKHVYRVTPEGQVEVFAADFIGASGNTFDATGNLYQSDIMNQRVVKVAPDGTTSTFMRGRYRGLIGNTFDAAGNFYVNECEANRVLIVRPDGMPEVFAESPLFACPNGLTTGPDRHLYAVNFRDSLLLRIQLPDAEVTAFASIPGGGNGHVTSANERIYVASFRGNQIYEVDMEGQVQLLAGTGEAGNTNGPVDRATFYQPNGIATSVSGDTLYVNTTLSVGEPRKLHPNLVRRITGVRRLAGLETP